MTSLNPEEIADLAAMFEDLELKSVVIDYVNYKRERSTRRIVPNELRFGSTEHHPEPQWLLEAFDRDKGVDRTFAMKDILSWRGAGPGEVKP